MLNSASSWHRIADIKREFRRLKSLQLIPGSLVPSYSRLTEVIVALDKFSTSDEAIVTVTIKPADVHGNDHVGLVPTTNDIGISLNYGEGWSRPMNFMPTPPGGGPRIIAMVDSINDDGAITYKAYLSTTTIAAAGTLQYRIQLHSTGPFPYRIASYSVQRKEAKLNNS